MNHDEIRACIENQNRRLGEALHALNEMHGSVPEELLAQVAREFERIAELTPQITETCFTTIGLRA